MTSPIDLLLRAYRPAPPAAVMLTEPAAIAASYRAWRMRVLALSIVGYATFYFVRKNLAVAMPTMGEELGITKESLGLFLTLHGLLYGVSKLANGFIADRANARTFMAVALVLSAILNAWFGLSSTLWVLGALWMLNGWAQGMGFPPCARLMTNWFPPSELATKFSIWNSSHNIGSIVIVLLCGFLVSGDLFAPSWRACFIVPAFLAVGCAAVLWIGLPDTPPSVGLPEVEGTETHEAPRDEKGFRAFVFRQVLGNKHIWLLAIANFFVYAIRYAVFDWGPTLLTEAKGVHIMHAAWMIAGFEACGLVGALLGGWVADRFLGGRVVHTCIVYMALSAVAILLFWKIETRSPWMLGALLCATGFFVYGPQCLLAIGCANLATKRAAATAIGLTSIFGYASTVLSGWGLGWLVQHHGWDAGFAAMIACAIIGTLLFVAARGAKAHGYAPAGAT